MENLFESKFIKVRCGECKNEQVIFGKASSQVKCLVCGASLVQRTGGKSQVNATILEVLN